MAKHSISEAAKLTGKARSTIHRHIKNGRISKTIGQNGNPYIDTAELVRVYGTLQEQSDTATAQKLQDATSQKYNPNTVLWDEVKALQQEKIDQLESRIAELASERDEWREQAKALRAITDQRQKSPQKPVQGRLARAWGVITGKR